MTRGAQDDARVEETVAVPPHVEAAPRALFPPRPALRPARHEEHDAKRVPEALEHPPLDAALVPPFRHAVHVHAVESGSQAGQRGQHKGSGAVGPVLRALEGRVQDEQGGGGDEEGDHGPVEALLERVVVEADVDAREEAREDEGQDAGEVEQQTRRGHEGRVVAQRVV